MQTDRANLIIRNINSRRVRPPHIYGRLLAMLVFAAWLLTVPLVPGAVMATDDIKRILVLHSYHKGLGWTDSISEGIESIVRPAPDFISIHYEYMDTKRVFDDSYLNQLAAIYRYKYRDRQFDVIISSDDHAFRFLLNHHDDLFSGVPVVFCGVNFFKDAYIANRPYFTGVVESFSIKDTIDGALIIDPNINKVYAVVDNTVTGKANRKLVDSVVPKYAGRLQFEYITDVDMAEVQKLVGRLPENSIVLLLSFTSDRSGNTFSLELSAELVTQASNRPVYGFWDFYLNHGIVGGMLTTGNSHGKKAAQIAMGIINGEKPSSIPVLKKSPNQYIFDYSQMRKFNILPEQLPPGSIIINRPLTLYQQHHVLVWQVIIAFAVLIIFTVLLMVNLYRRHATEALLIKSEDKFRALVETTSDLIWESDRQARYTYVSPTITDLLGYTPKEILGKKSFDFMAPEEVLRIKSQTVENWEKGDAIVQLKSVNRHKDGHDVILETTGIPFFDTNGQLAGYRGIARDITDRHIAEKALQESEARFRHMAELLPETIFEVDLEGNLLYTNQSGFNQFQYTLDDFEKGMHISNFIHTSDYERMMGNFFKVANGEDVGLNEYSAVRKDGSRFPVMARSSVIQKNGNPVGLRGFIIDISDRKRLEAQLNRAQRMESIGTLAGGIAHDFNNLLMGIQGLTQLVQKSLDKNFPKAEHLNTILEHVKSASQLTNQLLGFARAGKYNPMATDINHLIKKTADMFGRTKKELRITQELSNDLLPVMVDCIQIEQVLLNLFVNAWHAMPDGGDLTIISRNRTITVAERQSYHLAPAEYVEIMVKDTGSGMDAKTKERIFEPFFSTKPRGRGTGLGLASAYGIVSNHNGSISVTSEPGKGATFTVLLPTTKEKPESNTVADENIPMGTETVLLVDDEDMILVVGTEMLQTLGYHVIAVQGGQAALAVFEERQDEIDIVVLDMIMPDLNGKETFVLLKSMNPNVRVLLSSGYSMDGEAASIIEQGCNGFIQKPFDLMQLAKKMREIFKDKEDA